VILQWGTNWGNRDALPLLLQKLAAVLEALTSDVQQEARKIVDSALNASN
jgi:hypothetical protein